MEPQMARRHIQTEIVIDAPVGRVWSVLTDFADVSAWNPLLTSISGTLAEGEKLRVGIELPNKWRMRIRPVVVAVRPEREFRWQGGLFVKGMFDGEHYFLLDPLDAGRTRFRHGEFFSGVLVGAMGGMLAATEKGFGMMNVAIKDEAERA
jgi:hypothetical protein